MKRYLLQNVQKKERDQLTSKVSQLDTGYASEMENRIKSSLAAAQSKIKGCLEKITT